MTLLLVRVVLLVVAVLVVVALWWSLTRRSDDHGEVSDQWRHQHGSDQGKRGGSR